MDVSAGDVLLVAVFSSPQFSLLSGDRFAGVCGALYRELVPFGVRATDMELASSRNLAASSLKVPLFNFALTVRLTVSQLELQFLGTTADDRNRLLEVAGACERAIADMLPPARWNSVSLDLRLHGRLSGKAPSAVVDRFVARSPQSLGNLLASGVSFYFTAPGSEPDLNTGLLLLEPSNVVPEGLFFRVQMTWGAIASLPSIRASTDKYLHRCADEVSVSLRGVWA